MSDKIIKFSAEWCTPCQMLGNVLKSTDLGVPVESVDIDDNLEQASKFGIRSVPTLVYIRDGAEIARTSGMKTELQLKQWVSTI